ncbi:MAG TPA: hypothetical protein VHX49_12840 [Candidatus Acidoferrales bacterium]|jgi:hypothetical protein|nr:hypothetical protein [Candidatus Acidoferrales bacterium]
MSKHKQRHNPHQKASADDRKPACQDEVKLPAIYPIRIESSAEDRDRYADEKRHRDSELSVGKWLNRITTAGTVVALVGLIYLGGSLRATRRSADAAAEGAHAAQQQVLAFEATEAAQLIVTITPAQAPGVLDARVDTANDSILVDWDVAAKNIGPTIAREVGFSSDMFDIRGTNGSFAEPPGHPFATLKPSPSPSGSTVEPNGGTEHFTYTQQISGWRDIANKRDTIVIYMQISYVDIFGHPEFAPTCMYFDIRSRGFIRCPADGQS